MDLFFKVIVNIKKFSGRLKTNKTFITLLLWGGVIALMHFQYFYLAFFAVFIGCLFRIHSERRVIIPLLKNYFIRFYQIVILSMSYVLSLHIINYMYGIDKENLSFSPWVFAVLISMMLLFLLVISTSFCFMFSQAMLSPFQMFVSDEFKNKLANLTIVRLADKCWDMAFISIPIVAAAAYYSDDVISLALRIDAYTATDCAEPDSHRSYIRKNSNECYFFDNSSILSKPKLIKSIKP